jgi:hypothetical protein
MCSRLEKRTAAEIVLSGHDIAVSGKKEAAEHSAAVASHGRFPPCLTGADDVNLLNLYFPQV